MVRIEIAIDNGGGGGDEHHRRSRERKRPQTVPVCTYASPAFSSVSSADRFVFA